jgi:hypothetical protein
VPTVTSKRASGSRITGNFTTETLKNQEILKHDSKEGGVVGVDLCVRPIYLVNIGLNTSVDAG